MKKYIVRLDAKERSQLEQLVGVGKAAAYRIRHANTTHPEGDAARRIAGNL